MSKYEDFVIMKTYVFLITFGFIQLVFCTCDLNITDYDLLPVCPIHFFRRKRSYAEYTRWRGNQDLTTNEFLVEVLDEDLTTPQTKKIVAVNILPVTVGGEKIIIGGAKVPPPTSATATTDDCSQFEINLSSTPAERRLDGELVNAQKQPPKVTFAVVPPRPQLMGTNIVRNSQRDDSPPASPQFLARIPTLVDRQYAPIAPVAFNPRMNIAPLTPPSISGLELESSSHLVPTRAHTFSEITLPTRTTEQSDEFRRFNTFDDATDQLTHYEVATQSTYTIPERTITPLEINEVEAETELTTQKILEDNKKGDEEMKKVAEKDSESSYNMMFDSDEDNSEVNSRKDDQDINANYFDKKGSHEDSKETAATDSTEDDMDYPKNYSFTKDSPTTPKDNGLHNSTLKMLPAREVVIPTKETLPSRAKQNLRDKRRPFCSLLTMRQLNFNSPRTLPEITSQLKRWAEVSPMAKCIDITNGNYTTMENPIYMMIVDDPSSGQISTAKQSVMIVAGIQGRDHHAVAAAVYVLYQLIERSEAHSDLLTRYRFWIVPVFNPDGYEYSMTFPHRREWTKNLRQSWEVCRDRDACEQCDKHGLRCMIQPCYGVNLDRNFEYQWIPAEELRAEHPCGSLYSGVRQLSELETRALTHFLHQHHTSLFTFIAFKEGDILGVMYPHSHTRRKRPFDHVLKKRAQRAAAAASSISNRPYVAGQTSQFLPLYAGGIEDWVESHLGIDETYTIMLFRPTDSSYNTKVITEGRGLFRTNSTTPESFTTDDASLVRSLTLAPAISFELIRVGVRASSLCPKFPNDLAKEWSTKHMQQWTLFYSKV